MAFSTSTTALWTILSSIVAIPSGRCRPSAFGMNTRLDGFARYAPRCSLSCKKGFAKVSDGQRPAGEAAGAGHPNSGGRLRAWARGQRRYHAVRRIPFRLCPVSDPGLSLVLVSHNEGPHLRSTLDNLLETSPSGTEAIVVDDLSTDGSADFLDSGYAGARLLRPARRLGAPAARNHGAAAATGDVVVFSDAHVEAQPGWFEALRAVLDRPDVGMVGPVVSSLQNRDVKGYGRS